VKYLILIYHNPRSQAIWESMPQEQREQGWRHYARLNQELNDSREMIVSEALANPSEAIRIPAIDGQSLTTDGPFAEAKEYLAGFYLVDCDSQERAAEIAMRIPEAAFGLVEVRPVMDFNGVMPSEPA
jgi:hypothetical protein